MKERLYFMDVLNPFYGVGHIVKEITKEEPFYIHYPTARITHTTPVFISVVELAGMRNSSMGPP